MARLTRPQFLLPASFLLGVIFDFFFWGKAWGISFALFALLILAVGLWQAARVSLRPAAASWPLAALAMLFAAVSAVRAEPFTLLVTRAAALALLMLFAASFLAGDWWRYRFSDYVVRLLSLIPSGLLAGRDAAPARKTKQSGLRAALPILRGLLLALPVVFVLAALLASADAYFSQWLSGLLGFIQIERLPEYVFRLILIIVLAYCLFGSFLFAFLRSKQSGVRTKDLVAPFVGFTEALTVLTSVAVLFAAFVAIQFRYFFGGVSNVLTPDGLTYAEYARRGFAELVLVALVTLVLFIGLSALTERKPAQQRYFSGLGVALFVLVAVILASAFQRLMLYEEAYGFTRMRTIPHVFMVWLGLLLLALVVLEVTRRQKFFALTVFCAVVGFVATFPLLNLDAFIARSNVQREIARAGQDAAAFDLRYLSELSADAAPALAAAFHRAQSAGEAQLAEQIAAAAWCNALALDEYRPLPDWQSWTTSRSQARQTWLALRTDPNFPRLQAGVERGEPYVWLAGEQHFCGGIGWD